MPKHKSSSSYSEDYSTNSADGRRKRRNQPYGFDGKATMLLRCRKHDYMYYPSRWRIDGVSYHAGYYDEEGTYYDGIAVRDFETTCTCPECGEINYFVWSGGKRPKCSSCGETLQIPIADRLIANPEIIENVQEDLYEERPRKKTSGKAKSSRKDAKRAPVDLRSIVLLAAGVVIVLILFAAIINRLKADSASSGAAETQSAAEVTVQPEKIYIEEIGRECTLDDAGNYYDSESGTYVWFNTDIDPNQWQYWVEGISNNFGDYGWMEYDPSTDTWHIETETGWEVLPEEYDTSDLWHFEDGFTNNLY